MQFSCLISVYIGDKPEFFKEALMSIHRQTLKPSEIVLVNDGPLTNELLDVQNAFIFMTRIPVKVLSLDKNQGLGVALQMGLEICNYDWIARMDSDDISRKERFQMQIECLKQDTSIDVLGTGIVEFNGRKQNIKLQPPSHKEIVSLLPFRNPVSHVTVMFRKEKALSAGGYVDCPYFEDYFLWARMISDGALFKNIPVILVDVRVGKSMVGRRHGISYIKKEFSFLVKFNRLNLSYNKFRFYFNSTLRLLLRLMPKMVLNIIYNSGLR